MHISQRIVPCLWFDHQAEEAATFYVSVFKNSKVVSIARYTKAGQEMHKQAPGSVMTVAFELDGQQFTAKKIDISALERAAAGERVPA